MMLYEGWTAPKIPEWVDKSPRELRAILMNRVSYQRSKITACEADGINQVTPIVAVMEENPQQLKKLLGKNVWKVIHRSSVDTNANRACIWLFSLGRFPMSEIIEFRPCHLRKILRVAKRNGGASLSACHRYAGLNAPQHSFDAIAMLYRDAERMGVEVNPKWSVNRLKREHDSAAIQDAIAKTSPVLWAKPFRMEVDGFLFVRLVSDRDMSVEGLMQKHCVSSYSQNASHNRIAVFSISGDERATYAFDCHGRDVDLKGFANSRVSPRVRSAAKAFKKEFMQVWVS